MTCSYPKTNSACRMLHSNGCSGAKKEIITSPIADTFNEINIDTGS